MIIYGELEGLGLVKCLYCDATGLVQTSNQKRNS